MTPQSLFEAWAPPTGLWSPWAKPVMFAAMPPELLVGTGDMPMADPSWAPKPTARTGLLVDVPGIHAVVLGVALARAGYQPIPLFNTTPGNKSVLNLSGLFAALRDGGAVLNSVPRPIDSPPAFLVDSDRLGAGTAPSPGEFDNRWIVFPQDLPSGSFLRARGIDEILVVRPRNAMPQDDLRQVLSRWEDVGVRLSLLGLDTLRREPMTARLSAWQRFALRIDLALMSLRRNSAGGFGSAVPIPRSGSSFG